MTAHGAQIASRFVNFSTVLVLLFQISGCVTTQGGRGFDLIDDYKYAEAITFLEKVEEIDPQNVKLVQLRAYIDGMSAMEVLLNLDRPWNMEELNQADMAKAQAILLQEVNPSSPDGLILRGQVTAALDENERAKDFLEQALVLDPDNSFARVRLALIYRNLAFVAVDVYASCVGSGRL